MEEPKYFDMLNRTHLAPLVGLTPESLSVMLANRMLPPILPTYRAGGRLWYAQSTVDAWVREVEQWRADAPARAAAKRAETDRRVQDALDAEMARIRANKLIGDTAQQGHDALVAEMRDLDKR
ncbi:hypothetical protein [Variovorax fucosicus]|uniref:hypothetical protein n=1 Tax=Variovorax fucosicus TaxID=3053517 RepID=UPI002578003B|nr:hypothetical protein [Variovorax sp. J22G47]MDM0057341.1 hypothetical protein [Variovorax sp. J22G47]